MPRAKISDADFIGQFEKIGPLKLSRLLQCAPASVFSRRERIERKLGRQITGPDHRRNTRHNVAHPQRIQLEVKSGIVLVGSDAHYWPGEPSTAHRAFVKFCREMKPAAVIMNGDVLDCATVSRHPPIGWEARPSLIDEIELAKDRLFEIERAAGRARKLWPLGNHDGRFETRLATVAAEYAKVHGVHLKDHFALWEACWAVWINGDVVVKHRHKNGTHATHNSTLWAGKTMVTGHLHSLKVTPFSDYNDRPRWGVDTGTLADPYGPQFRDYQEDNPLNHRSGFAVLTFRNGVLLWPELVHVFDADHVEFRGEVSRV